MATRHRQEKTSGLLSTPSNGYAQHASSNKNRSDGAQFLWKRRPHVDLDWDACEQKVVSKRDQVAISSRHLILHFQWGSPNRLALADVITVPAELFQLKDLKDVFTVETWNESLSASEKQLLYELLPKNVDREGVVREILSGENFHFGNPLSTWGGQICKGEFHPDSVRKKDSEFKNMQKEYYGELQSYHHKMLETLGALKELWVSCKSTEKELNVKLKSWNKRKSLANGNVNTGTNPLLLQEFKSASVLGERKAKFCKATNKGLNEDVVIRQRCKQRKIGSIQEALERTDSLPAEESKRFKPLAHSSVNVDGCTEIMYTLKVSHKQYADIMELQGTGEELVLDSLTAILGDSQKLGVHRINGCDKKDTVKIREFWSFLVEKDMPAAHATFVERKALKQRLARSTSQECMQKLPTILCKVKGASPQLSSVSEDDEVSAIKNIWSSEDLDTEELHSQNGAMPAAREVNSLKGSNMWDSHSKPASEVLNVAAGSAESEEVEQRISYQTGSLCARVDTQLLDSQTMPSFQNHDRVSNFSRQSSFYRHQEPVSSGPLFYSNHASNTESSAEKQGLQHQEDVHHSRNAEYQFLMSLKASQGSDLHLQRGERRAQLFQMEQEKAAREQKRRMLLPKFLDQNSSSDGFQSVETNSNHVRLASPVATLQSSGGQGSLCDSSQSIPHLSLASQPSRECSQQNHEPTTELRLLVDNRSTEQLGHLQQSESSSRTHDDPGEHHLEQVMRHNGQQMQAFPFYQQLHQTQHLRQDLYSSGSLSPMLPGWPDSQQMSSGRAVSAASHFGPPSQWSVGDDAVQANWGHSEVVSAPFSTRGKNEDRRLPNFITNWDRLSQNPFIIDNGPPKHVPRTFSGGSYSNTEDFHGFPGQDDWGHVQPPSVNQHPYAWTGDKSRTGHPWMNLPPGSHISHQTSQYEQQTLQGRPVPKTYSWECFL